MPENHSGGGLVARMKTAKAVALAVGFSGLSALFSGCADGPQTSEDPGAGLAVLGMLAGFKGNQMAAQGNYQAAASGAALQDLAYGAANYQRQRAVAEAGRSEVNVNVPPQQEVRQQITEPTIILYSSNPSRMEGTQISFTTKETFGRDEYIELGVAVLNTSQMAVRIRYTHLETSFAAQSEIMILSPGSIRRLSFPPNSLAPGVYKEELINEKEECLKQNFFKVTE